VSGTPFATDRQAWIPQLELGAGLAANRHQHYWWRHTAPGAANCHGRTISALAHQFGSIDAASLALGASSVAALQEAIRLFSEP